MDREARKQTVEQAKTHTAVAPSVKKSFSRKTLLVSKFDTFTKALNSLVHMTVTAVLRRQTNILL